MCSEAKGGSWNGFSKFRNKTYVSACSHILVQRSGNDTSSETRGSYVYVIFLRGIASVLGFEN